MDVSNTVGLQNLPPHMLERQLQKAAVERELAQAQLLQLQYNKPFWDFKNRMSSADQKVWEVHVSHVLAKWEARTTSEGWTATECYQSHDKCLVYDEDKEAFLVLHGARPNSRQRDMQDVMSSAQLQLRIPRVFPNIHSITEGRPGGQLVWSAEVEHKGSGEALGFSLDLNGAPEVRLSSMKVPADFEYDVLELLELLLDLDPPQHYHDIVPEVVAE